ncbi:phage portal protein, partial [Bacillus thuringiensis]|nr:phage portal protein [Bacillus thuringiensis]
IAGDIAKSTIRTKPNEKSNEQVMKLLSTRPDTNHTSYTWLYGITMYALVYGSAFAIIRRNGNVVTRLQVVSPYTVTILQDSNTKELYYEYQGPDKTDVETFASSDVLHFRLNTI